MSTKILIFTRDPDAYRSELAVRDVPDADIWFAADAEDVTVLAKEADIFLGVPTLAKPYIRYAENLKWFQSSFAGIDALVSPELRSDYTLTNVKEVYGSVMAEYVMAYIFMFEKKLLEHVAWQENKEWMQQPYNAIEGKVLGILGVGSIGSVIAQKAKAFGMHVIGLRREHSPHPDFDEIYTSDDLLDFASKADYLVSVLPSTPHTIDMINKDVFDAMSSECVFMNVGRGASVCELSLQLALENKKIKAAVIDVFKEEPLPKDSPLWSVPNLYITPHVSGYTLSKEIFNIFEENYRRFREGSELLHIVEFERGY